MLIEKYIMMNTKKPKRILYRSSHPIKAIISSRQPGMILLKYGLIFIVAIMGLLGLKFAVQSLHPPFVYAKDFIQDYLLARAVLDDVDPYLPIRELVQRFLDPSHNFGLQHPTPHPPPVVLLSLPFGLLSYEQAAVVWFFFEMICIVVSVYLLLSWIAGRAEFLFTIFITLLVLAWSPFQDELACGQLMALLLILLIGVWQFLFKGNNIKGGIFLGFIIALKLMAWPIVIFLLIRKNWMAVIMAGLTAITANLGAALLMGIDKVLYYYLKVTSIVPPLYRAWDANFSIWTIGWRLFEGTRSPSWVVQIEAPPLLNAPVVAPYFSIAGLIVLLSIALVLALRAKRFNTSFGILVCVSLLVNPVTWSHYLILTLIPLAIVARRLFSLDLPKKETWFFIIICLIFFIPRSAVHWFTFQLSCYELSTNNYQIPFTVALLTFIPATAVLGLLWFVWHTEQIYLEKHF